MATNKSIKTKLSHFSPGNSASYCGLCLNSKHTSKSTCICRSERSPRPDRNGTSWLVSEDKHRPVLCAE